MFPGRTTTRADLRTAADIPTPPTPTLLSLPNELLARIASDVAPNGGRQAGNLRLTCRHLSLIVAPVVWASLRIPADVDTQNTIMAGVIRERKGFTRSVKSVRYALPTAAAPGSIHLAATVFTMLPNLARLHVFGRAAGEIPVLVLPVELWDAFSDMSALDTLVLHDVDLRDVPHPGASPLKVLKHFGIWCCLTTHRIMFTSPTEPHVPIAARSFEAVGQHMSSGDGITIWLLCACLGSSERVKVQWMASPHPTYFDTLSPWVSSRRRVSKETPS